MDKLLSALSLAKRAGKIVMGFDAVKDAVMRGSASLVLFSSDLSEKSKRGIVFACEEYAVNVLDTALDMDCIWFLLGKRAGIVAVEDKGFADMIEKAACVNEEVMVIYDDEIQST